MQSLPATPDSGGDQPKKPQLIPIRVGLLGASGRDLQLASLSVDGGAAKPLGGATEAVLPLAAMSSTFTIGGVAEEPVVASILRDFSAPVHLKVSPEPTEQQLTFLLQNDSDAFNRFEAAQTLGARRRKQRFFLQFDGFDRTTCEPAPEVQTLIGLTWWFGFLLPCRAREPPGPARAPEGPRSRRSAGRARRPLLAGATGNASASHSLGCFLPSGPCEMQLPHDFVLRESMSHREDSPLNDGCNATQQLPPVNSTPRRSWPPSARCSSPAPSRPWTACSSPRRSRFPA